MIKFKKYAKVFYETGYFNFRKVCDNNNKQGII